MNQEQAKKLIEFTNVNGWEFIAFNLAQNRDHILEFSRRGAYQYFYDGEWHDSEFVPFLEHRDNYRPVPEHRINWEKAMENGAFGTLMIFWNGAAREEKRYLRGYTPKSQCRNFIADDLSVSQLFFDNCKPLPGFEIPESWLEDELK